MQTNEIRKNRYFHDFHGVEIEIDVFLGELWGLIIAQIYFENAEELNSFEPPNFAVTEVTKNGFFAGKNVLGKTFADVQNEYERSA